MNANMSANMTTINTIRTWLAVALLAAAGVAAAQAFPSKPIRLLVGAPAGGTTDTLARSIAAEMTRTLGQDMKKRLALEGAVPVGNSSADFSAFVREDLRRWAPVVQYSGAKAE